MHIAQFINTEGSLNYRILYALYKSQIDEKTATIKENVRDKVINFMIRKFKSLDENDTVLAKKIEEVVLKAFHKSNNIIYCYDFIQRLID